MRISTSESGFSLVELSIVLVILGLLTGGILAGQSLIRASELRAVTSEHQRYTSAINAFRDKYFALPGDMTNATSFWGAAHATPATCLTTVGTGTQTCNGDGDGVTDAAAAASQYGERFTFWQHLANAGVIEGSYSGRAGSASNTDHRPGVNCAPSKIAPGGWSPYQRGVSAGSAGAWFAGDYGNELAVMGWSGGGPVGMMRPEEVWNIDAKLDDGRPGRGRILPYPISTCTDAGAAAGSQNDLDADYLLTSNAIDCSIFFAKSF